MEFNCNLDELDSQGLTFTEYLILFSIYNSVRYKNIIINEKVYDLLIDKDYIKAKDDYYELTDKGFDFFAPKVDLFDKFIETFPTRVVDPVSGAIRILSPAKAGTISGNKIRKKWISITKGNSQLQEHIIECLLAEIELRKKANNLQFMRNIETWLNNGTWEDYSFYITEKNKPKSSNEIRL
jgi:hypothetical protein